MNYWQLRRNLARLVPRMTSPIIPKKTTGRHAKPPKTKGRKHNYYEYKLLRDKWIKQEKLLNRHEINSFVEISCRAAACPMPFNVDVWDGITCPFACRYCFAFSFRSYLYTAFFDNVMGMGPRHCNPNRFKQELDKLMPLRGTDPHRIKSAVNKAIALEIPLRFGIRFEDFLRQEEKAGVSLELLRYLADQEYPTMINTKSSLVGKDAYVDALVRNKAKSAVHVTLISSDNKLLKLMEPGAPSYKDRLETMRILVDAGVRVVARIEPFMVFINDHKDDVDRYIQDLQTIGVRNITFDTYSYTAKTPALNQNFKNMGMDLERILLLGCDSQALGSLSLGLFMDYFRQNGFSCSTFDMGNVPDNAQDVCCEVGDWFENVGYNYGSSVFAARLIQRRGLKGKSTSWRHFENWVNKKGGFLSDGLKLEAYELWNCEGSNTAYSLSWARNIEPVGFDEYGTVYAFKENVADFRLELYDVVKEII